MYCLQSMCSICLKYNNEHLINLNSKSTDDIPLVDKLEFCIPGTHQENRNSYLICASCVQKLNTSYEFITLCKTSGTKYDKYISQLSNDAVHKNQHNLKISLLDIRKIGLLDHLDLKIKQETIDESENATAVVEYNTHWDHDYCVAQYENILNNTEIEIEKADSLAIIAIANEQNNGEKNESNEDGKMQTEIKQEVLEYDPARSQCAACKKYFSSRHQYIVHFKIRIYQLYRKVYKKYKCCTCFKSFMNRKKLYDHILTHSENPVPAVTIKSNIEITPKGKFKCNICAQQFRLIKLYEKHVQAHKIYSCKICSKKFYFRQKLNEHSKLHIATKYICKLSNDKFQNKITLKREICKFKCQLCNKSFDTPRGVKAHAKMHTVIYCTICNKGFYGPKSLSKHKLTHRKKNKSENKYTELNLENTQNSNAQKESTENLKKKDQQVNITTNQNTNMIDVYSNGKTKFTDRVYLNCTICNKRFKGRRLLRIHKMTHKKKNKSEEKYTELNLENNQNLTEDCQIPQSTNMNAIFDSNAQKESTENLEKEDHQVNITATEQNTNTNDAIYINDPKESIGNLKKESCSNQQIIDSNITASKENTNMNDAIYINDPKESIGNLKKDSCSNQQIIDSNITATEQNTNMNDVIYINTIKLNTNMNNDQTESTGNCTNQQMNVSNITTTKQNTNMNDVIYIDDQEESTENIKKEYQQVNITTTKQNSNMKDDIYIDDQNESTKDPKTENQQVNVSNITTTKQNSNMNDILYSNQKGSIGNLKKDNYSTKQVNVINITTTTKQNTNMKDAIYIDDQDESTKDLKKENQQVNVSNITTTKQNSNMNDILYSNQKGSTGNLKKENYKNQQVNVINITTTTKQNTNMKDAIYIDDQDESSKDLKKENQEVNVLNITTTKQNSNMNDILYGNQKGSIGNQKKENYSTKQVNVINITTTTEPNTNMKESTKDLKKENQEVNISNITTTKQNSNMNNILYSNQKGCTGDLKKGNYSTQQVNVINITTTKQNTNMKNAIYIDDQNESTKDLKKENQEVNVSNITPKQNTNMNDILYTNQKGSTGNLKKGNYNNQEVNVTNITTKKQNINMNDILYSNQKGSTGNLKKENYNNQQVNVTNITTTKQNTNMNDILYSNQNGPTGNLKIENYKNQQVNVTNITTTKQNTNMNDILYSNQNESTEKLKQENCNNQQINDSNIIIKVDIQDNIKTFTLQIKNNNSDINETPNMQKENVLKVPDNKIEATNLQDTTQKTENNINQNFDEIKIETTCETNSSLLLDNNVPSISQNNSTSEVKSDISERILQCKFCKEVFNNKVSTMAHYSSLKMNELNRVTKIYTCCICKAIFNLKRNWQNHMTLHLSKIFSCNRCPKSYLFKLAYDKHRRIHEQQKYLCMVCYYKFDNEEQLKHHFFSSHCKKDPEAKSANAL